MTRIATKERARDRKAIQRFFRDKTIVSPFTLAQQVLRKKHGTPAQFAAACYENVPGFISMEEARSAIDKYNREWSEAAQ